MKYSLLLFALLSTQPPFAASQAEEWHQFRGPNANGISTDSNLPIRWNADTNLRWQVDVAGDAWSCPVIADGKVFLTTAITSGPQSDQSEYRWEVLCLDAKSGEKLWSKVALQGKPRLKTHRDNTYASETPVTDGKYVVVYFGMMGLFCYDTDGNLVWQKDLGNFPMSHDWGTSSSPALLDGKVFLQVDSEQDSFVVALDIATGNEIWRKARDERSNWGSAIIWKNDKRTELVTGGAIVRSYNPADGELLWQLNIENGGLNTTPSGSESMLVVGRGGRGGTSIHAIGSGGSGDISKAAGESSNEFVLWSSQEMGPERSSPLILDDYVFFLSGRGGKITCVDAKTGIVNYQARLPGAEEFWASPWASQGLIFCPDSAGKTFVVEPGKELKVVATNTLPVDSEERFWASPVVADGMVYIRSNSTLYAIEN